MALKLTETRIDHRGLPLPVGAYALTTEEGTIANDEGRLGEGRQV